MAEPPAPQRPVPGRPGKAIMARLNDLDRRVARSRQGFRPLMNGFTVSIAAALGVLVGVIVALQPDGFLCVKGTNLCAAELPAHGTTWGGVLWGTAAFLPLSALLLILSRHRQRQ